jgi:cutinase
VSAAPCPDVEVVSARATTEPPGVGQVGQAFVDSLRSHVGARFCSPGSMSMPSHDEMFSDAHLSYLKSGMASQGATFAAGRL